MAKKKGLFSWFGKKSKQETAQDENVEAEKLAAENLAAG